MNFNEAFEELMAHEGGYSHHPDDNGGVTMLGVTAEVARDFGYMGDMRRLPVSVAQEIYKKRYWDVVRAEEMPAEIRYALFDAAVNSGPKRAIMWLQIAAGAAADGVLGAKTMGKIAAADPTELKLKMISNRLLFMTNLSDWKSFGAGWSRRIAAIMKG